MRSRARCGEFKDNIFLQLMKRLPIKKRHPSREVASFKTSVRDERDIFGSPNGIRTRVLTLRGLRPRPLVDGADNFLAGEPGFEPRLPDPESGVLPLDDSPTSILLVAIGGAESILTQIKSLTRVRRDFFRYIKFGKFNL